MSLDPFDVTVVLTGHREGLLIHRTLRSILRAIDFAVQQGLRCEIVAVLDRPDQVTADYFERVNVPVLRVVEVDHGDPGLARNQGVAEAVGEYIAFIDGDDLVCQKWLGEAFSFAERQRAIGRRSVLHPELNVFFGADWSILTHVDQESTEWSLASLFAANYWTTLAFTRRDDLVAVPYRASSIDSGFAYEDWQWNCSAVSAGMVHKVVPDTWHFLRLKGHGSRNRVAQERNLLIRPSPLFDRLETEFPAMQAAESTVAGCSESAADGALAKIASRPQLFAEWRDLANIEPALFPTLESLRRYRFWQPSVSWTGEIFGRLLRRWGPAPSHVILCEQFARGDDGLAALSHVHALAEAGADVVVVAEEVCPVRIDCYSSGSVRLVEFGKIAGSIDPYWRSQLLARALLQRPPKTVHLIESKLGCDAISSYGPAIASASRIFATIRNGTQSFDVERPACVVSYLDRVAPYLSGFLGESQAILNWLSDTFGFPLDRCHKVYSAQRSPVGSRKPVTPRLAARPRALWLADHGRLACPAMLLQIARLMPEWDFVVFQRHTTDLPWADELNAALLAEENICWAANGDTPENVLADASAFLHTSLVDEFPRVFVDASAAAVPIVAPALRAIGEFIDEETGYPVDDFCSPDAYAARLREVLAEPANTRKRLAKAQRRITKECSWENFIAALQAIDGYL